MDRGVIIHLDNDQNLLDNRKRLFDQCGIDLDYITCTTKEEFRSVIKENSLKVKVLIFDLLSKEPGVDEIINHEAEFLQEVRDSFASLNIPVFIYSGWLHDIQEEFKEYGTVFKVDKGEDDFKENIIDKIEFLLNSGFIEVFCPGGILERELHIDLHKAFTKQFISNIEIEKSINSIKGNLTLNETSTRIKKVLKRVAIRTLLSELLMPEVNAEGHLVEETVSTSEHYIRRIGSVPIWTGDIWKKNDSDDFVFVLTPRCNVIRATSILVCPFVWKEIISKKDKISKMLQGDPMVSGYDRHLPPSPLFEGGKLSLSKYFMIEKEKLIGEYKVRITLSDELTNEILGKFGSHFFRTGITPWDPNEAAEEINTHT